MTARVGRRARRSRVRARPRVRARARVRARVRARWNLDAVPVSTEILGRAERHKGGEAEQDPTRSLHFSDFSCGCIQEWRQERLKA